MNVFKFLSATLLASICLFSGFKKEKSIVPENPSVVEITVSNVSIQQTPYCENC